MKGFGRVQQDGGPDNAHSYDMLTTFPATSNDDSGAAWSMRLSKQQGTCRYAERSMDFQLTDEQVLIRETFGRFLAERYNLARRREYLAERQGFSRANWKELADLGLIGLPFPREMGGLGGNAVDMMIIMEEIGFHAAVEPFAASAIVGAQAVSSARDANVAAGTAEEIISGAKLLTYALFEEDGRYDPLRIRTLARSDEDGFLLTGAKRLVPYPGSDLFLVSAVTTPDAGKDGIALFLVPGTAPGLSIHDYTTIDGLAVGDLHFDNVRLPPGAQLVGAERSRAAIEELAGTMTFAYAAEALGILRRMFETTTEYLKTRVQFGRPLAAKQVVRHRLAEMYMHCELARSAVIGAAVREPGSVDWRRSVAAAKITVDTAGDFIGKQAVQLHGGMGVSDEYEVSHYYKRLLVLKALFGDARKHAGELARLTA